MASSVWKILPAFLGCTERMVCSWKPASPFNGLLHLDIWTWLTVVTLIQAWLWKT
jgi:hypothetical protein